MTIIELMLFMNQRNAYLYYHKDTHSFDRCPISQIELKNLDLNAKIPEKDLNNFRFPSYEEIDHKEIMRFFVRECIEDKGIRKQLFDILRRDNFVDAFIEKLRELELYEDFEMACGSIYEDIFDEWIETNHLESEYQ